MARSITSTLTVWAARYGQGSDKSPTAGYTCDIVTAAAAAAAVRLTVSVSLNGVTERALLLLCQQK
jgi:hypothetical protein